MKISGSSSNLPPSILSARAIVRMFHRFESATRDSGLSFAQYRILGFLQNGPHRAGQLAVASAVKKPTVSTLLNGLRRRGWISDRTNPVDGRVVTVVLTTAGRRRLRAFDNRLARTLEAHVSKADLPMIVTALVRLYASLNAVGHAETRRERPQLRLASDRRKIG